MSIHGHPVTAGDGIVIYEQIGRHTNCNRMSLAEGAVAPGQKGKAHYHRYVAELFIVVKGEGEIYRNAEVVPVKKGDIVRISPGVIHAVKNTGSRPLTVQSICHPAHTETDTYYVE